MSKPTFDVIAYRARLGLTQAELGGLMHMSNPHRAVWAWEAHQRSKGRVENGPAPAAIAYMELLDNLWRLYHALSNSTAKALLGRLLHEKLLLTGPARGNRWCDR